MMIESVEPIIPDKSDKVFRFLYFSTIVLLLVSKSIYIKISVAHIRIFDLTILLLSIFFIWNVLIKKKTVTMSPLGVFLPFLFLLFYSLLLLPFQEYFTRTIVEMVELIELLLMFLIVWNVPKFGLSKFDFNRIVDMIFFLSLIGGLIGVGYYLAVGGRFVGKWFIFGSFPFGLYYSYYYYIDKKKVIYLLYFLIFTLVILFSRTRGLWITSAAALPIIHVFHYKRQLNKSSIKPILIGFMGILLMVIIITDLQARILSFFNGSQHLYSRPVLWLAGINIFINHPYGVGLGNFDFYVAENIRILFEKGIYHTFLPESQLNMNVNPISQLIRTVIGPHSDWIKFLVETGFIGVILYGFFWFKILYEVLFKKINSTKSIILATVLVQIFLLTFLSLKILSGGFLIIVYLYLFLYFNQKEQM